MKTELSRVVCKAFSFKPIVTAVFLGCMSLLPSVASAQVNVLLWVPTAGVLQKSLPSTWPGPLAWNHGRDGVFSTGEITKSYQINPGILTLAFGHTYQPKVWDLTPEAGNDAHISGIYREDVKMDHYMRANNQLPTARILPTRVLWAAHHKQYPDPSI